MSDAPKNWRELNRANWDERVAVHLKSPGYDLTALRAGRGALNPVDEAELGTVKGLRVLHLQCHFGADTLSLAQRGATVVGLDFSGAAIAAARDLAAELGLADRARFVESDLYDAPAAIAGPASFDLVYTSWGVTCWLPDIRRWAEIVAQFLKPDGRFYYADAHPASYVFDDGTKLADGRPGYFTPYFGRKPIAIADHRDYADPAAHLANATNVEWLHPLSDILGGLIDAGLALDWLHEHARCRGACSRCWCRKTTATGTGRTSRGCRSPSRYKRGGAADIDFLPFADSAKGRCRRSYGDGGVIGHRTAVAHDPPPATRAPPQRGIRAGEEGRFAVPQPRTGCRRRSASCSRSHRKAAPSGSQPSQRAAWNRYSPVSSADR